MSPMTENELANVPAAVRREVEEAERLALRAQETAATPQTEPERQIPASEETGEPALSSRGERVDYDYDYDARRTTHDARVSRVASLAGETAQTETNWPGWSGSSRLTGR